MKYYTPQTPLRILTALLIFFVIVFLNLVFLYGNYKANDDKIIKEDKNYLYVMEYSPFNKDSTIKKYHKPIVVEAKIIKLDEKHDRIYLKNIKNGQEFNYKNEKAFKKINKNKTYKFIYTYYPKSKEGYKFIE